MSKEVNGNNNQIDNTDYYRLPCGRYLEDFIAWKKLPFSIGSALKYYWRMGKKDGESVYKDLKKVFHYVSFVAAKLAVDFRDVFDRIADWADEAAAWDGVEK